MNEISSGFVGTVIESFVRSPLYQQLFSRLPDGLDNPYLDLILVAVLAVVLLLVVINILMAAMPRPGRRKQAGTKRRHDEPKRKRQSGDLPKSARKPETRKAPDTRSGHSDDHDRKKPPARSDKEIDIDRLLAEKAREETKRRSRQPKQDVNEFDRILANIRAKNEEKALLDRQNAEEERMRERNMSILESKVTSGFKVEGAERDDSSDEIRRMQEEDKQARIKELAERKKRKK